MRELRPLTPDSVADLVGACAPCTFWQTVPTQRTWRTQASRESSSWTGSRRSRPTGVRLGASPTSTASRPGMSLFAPARHVPRLAAFATAPSDPSTLMLLTAMTLPGHARPWPAQGAGAGGGQGRPAPPVAVARGRGRASARRLETRLRARRRPSSRRSASVSNATTRHTHGSGWSCARWSRCATRPRRRSHVRWHACRGCGPCRRPTPTARATRTSPITTDRRDRPGPASPG